MIPAAFGGRRSWLAVASVIWLLTVGAGLAALWSYALTPGPAPTVQATWPAGSGLARDASRPTLVLLAHPHCACSRATIGELAVALMHARRDVTIHVLFYRPSGAEAGWERTDLWESAAAIPGVHVTIDDDGELARVFGATTSGQVLLYGVDDTRLFSGGITGARGHSGDNPGRSAVESLLLGLPSPTRSTPVFGCAIRESTS